MNKNVQIFEKKMGLKVKKIILLPIGLTNDDYFIQTNDNQSFIMRITKPQNKALFNYKNEDAILKVVAKTNLDIPPLKFDSKTGIKITRFVEGLSTFSTSKLSLNTKVKLVALGLKKLHSLKINSSIKFDPFKKLDQYKQRLNQTLFKDEAEVISLCLNDYQNGKHCLTHNDLVDGNLLFNKKRLYLIDYEYAGNNHPYFDLASFLSENNIENKKDIITFLKYYFSKQYSPKKLDAVMNWYRFNDLLWSYWAKMMYQTEGKAIYKKIYNYKRQRYLKTK